MWDDLAKAFFATRFCFLLMAFCMTSPLSQMVYFSTAGHTFFTIGLCATVLRTAGVFTTGD